MNVISKISSFFLSLMAISFGVQISPDKRSLVPTVVSILGVMFFSAVVHGYIFGKRAVVGITLAATAAMIVTWLPLLMYATAVWVGQSAVAICVLVVAVFFGAKGASVLRERYSAIVKK